MDVFSFNGSDLSYGRLIRDLGVDFDEHVIDYRSKAYDLMITRFGLEEGLHLYHWECRSKRAVELNNNFLPFDNALNYLICYVPEDQFSSWQYQHDGLQPVQIGSAGILFLSKSARVTLRFGENDIQTGVVLHFTHAWLIRQVVDPRRASVMTDYITKLGSLAPIRLQSSSEMILVRELLKELTDGSKLILIKSYVYQLLTFLYKQVSLRQQPKETQPGITGNMLKVENYMLQFLKGNLPAIEQIASKFYLSVSTLKRHFRKTYQSSIYEYYLARKLELAEKMLKEGAPVSQVSLELGYESVSHFSQIYKKYFGAPPGRSRSSK